MKLSEIKDLIISSMSKEGSFKDSWKKLEEAGVSYSFSNDFRDIVLDKISAAGVRINSEIEFLKSMNYAFYRIAITGVAAIVILLISIFLMEGSLSFNSFFGLSDNFDESIVCLLTGN